MRIFATKAFRGKVGELAVRQFLAGSAGCTAGRAVVWEATVSTVIDAADGATAFLGTAKNTAASGSPVDVEIWDPNVAMYVPYTGTHTTANDGAFITYDQATYGADVDTTGNAIQQLGGPHFPVDTTNGRVWVLPRAASLVGAHSEI